MLIQYSNWFLRQRIAMMQVMLSILLLPGTLEAQTSMIMEDFESPDVQARIQTLDSRFELVDHAGSRAIKVESGVDKPYPNIRVSAPATFWDITRFTRVEADVTNLGSTSLRLGMRLDNKGATGRKNSNTGGSTLAPGETATIGVDIDRIFATDLRDSLKGMQATPWGIRGEWGGVIDPAKVEQINFFISNPVEPYHFIIDNIRTAGVFDPGKQRIPEPFFPFIDRFGQYIHSQWPGKVTDESQLREAAQREAQEVTQSPRPDSWTQYGGWKDGPQLPATGHFYPIKHEGKWHLVDPEGRLFFSMGMDVVKAGSSTVIDQGRDSWFKDAPWKSGNAAMQELVGTATPRRGEYKDVKVQTFDFYAANLLHKYGPDYRNLWLKNTPKRLMNWGFNTIGCWADPEIIKQPGIPYTHWIYINSAKLPWQPGTRNRISDPWHTMFETEIRRRAANMIGDTVNDPWCIGYFLDNELSWGEETHLAHGLLKAPKDQPAKKQFIDWLRAKYDSIETLNRAWGTEHPSWQAMLEGNSEPKPDQAHDDLVAFNEVIVRQYFSVVRRIIKELAPNKLYLGCRFAEYNPQVVKVASEYCDVVSFNLYRETLLGWQPVPGFDKPVIVGEFHFGSTDRGVFNNGLRGATTTEERAQMLVRYIRSARDNPLVVGAHWFQLLDQPATGRALDAENHGIGFLSITDTPHDAMIQATRSLAGEIYK